MSTSCMLFLFFFFLFLFLAKYTPYSRCLPSSPALQRKHHKFDGYVEKPIPFYIPTLPDTLIYFVVLYLFYFFSPQIPFPHPSFPFTGPKPGSDMSAYTVSYRVPYMSKKYIEYIPPTYYCTLSSPKQKCFFFFFCRYPREEGIQSILYFILCFILYICM